MVPKHQRTRRSASASRWAGRGCTGITHVLLWAEGWGSALGPGLCLWGALQGRNPHTFPSARALSSPAGHPPGLRSGSRQHEAQPEPSQGRNTPAGSYHAGPGSSPSGGFVPKREKLTTLWEPGAVRGEQRHRGLQVSSLARCWNNSPYPTEVVFREPPLASFTACALCSHAQVWLLTWCARAGRKSLLAHHCGAPVGAAG